MLNNLVTFNWVVKVEVRSFNCRHLRSNRGRVRVRDKMWSSGVIYTERGNISYIL